MLRITDFAVQRNWKQAVIFYLIYVVALFILSAALGTLVTIIALRYSADPDFLKKIARITGEIIALVSCPLISGLILKAKKIRDAKMLLLLLATLVLSLGGGLCGMIIPAFLTTRPKEK